MEQSDNTSQFIIYQTEDGETKLDVHFQDETVWLTQKLLSELLLTTPENILMHLKNIYKEAELDEQATTKDFLVVRQEGARQVTRQLKHYNLDAIISVGYRVKSHTATRFRQWATQQLREYIVKGFVLDDERLKNPDQPFDYFEELTRRIQDIRTSEKRFYTKITDIYATSTDYDPTLEGSISFFKTVQNKVHWAITGKTAAELIKSRANSSESNMGLTNWRGSKVRKQDVVNAKNYLQEDELLALNNLDGFLSLNDRNILDHAGKVTHQLAKQLAEKEYEQFSQQRLSDEAKAVDNKDLDQLTKLADAVGKSKNK